ncbi:hypothetical protein [Azospirillum tabaci]|uniref:hypothetical protein n=1 Tax=Azospirillum tabaci TaxID=2752310 RepID=UPI00166007CA|nr:hypothetical protein [Azospirillum tabaci]
MGHTNVTEIDLSRYESAMVSRFGHTETDRDEAFLQVKAILSDAQTHEHGRRYAVPKLADAALHAILLDTRGALKIGADLYGAGNAIIHDPFPATSGPEAEAAWENTRMAFAAAGHHLPDHKEAIAEGLLSANDGCWLLIQPLAA